MKDFNNEIMLITYADSMGENLKDLNEVLLESFKDEVGGVHILPFFPSSADRGFAPMTYRKVDQKFGDFSDLDELNKNFYLMYDFMINHISAQSDFFKDFKDKKDESEYKDFFIRYKDFWPGGKPTQEQVDKIYKRKDRAPSIEVKFNDGSKEDVWCTFSEEQIDLNLENPKVKKFIKDTLEFLINNGANIIRLDAFAYAIKKIGSACFFEEPEIWELLKEIEDIAESKNAFILPEVHEHYTFQHKMADHNYWIYDFALPGLVLNALYTAEGKYLAEWLNKSPNKQFTTLDTHDGIGMVDIVDLVPNEEIERTKDILYKRGSNVNRKYSSAEYNNLDIYQINTTYYSALGEDDKAYLLARAIQFFAKGIPQVYYVGLLAGRNDLELLEETKNGRDINRHYYSKEEIKEELQRPVVKDLMKLMRFRNKFPAFDLNSTFQANFEKPDLIITRDFEGFKAKLIANLETKNFEILAKEPEEENYKTIFKI